MIRTGQVASEHQAVERRVFNATINVGAQQREQLLARSNLIRLAVDRESGNPVVG
jgi:hypothetical protein